MAQALFVVGIAAGAAILSEALAYVLVYRTEHFQSLKDQALRGAKRFEKMKEEAVGNKADKKKKQMDMLEDNLKGLRRSIEVTKAKSMILSGLMLISIYHYMSSIFGTAPVARLPFEPFGFVQWVSHRNVAGDDPRDCSFAFVYLLSMLTLRQSISRLTGFDLRPDVLPGGLGTPS
eukprot:m.101868 g.101868  ORF g.101868 m.101868 type:complete len:176 (+) comp14100_c0_seq3:43-570(+)